MGSVGNDRLKPLLMNVLNASNAIRSATAPGTLPRISPPTSPVNLPALPHTPDILPELEAAGAPASIIIELLEWFDKACRALRQRTETAILNTPIKSTQTVRAFEAAYSKKVYALKDHLLKRVSNASAKKSTRVPFNQEYTPLLEKYFRDNAYPSPADRAMLARKTQMTLRQIEVWFQNHRRRARADGKSLPRRSYDANPEDYTLENLNLDSPRSTAPRRSRSTSASPTETSEDDHTAPSIPAPRWTPHTPIDIVKASPPPHAFPTPFSSNHIDDPFPFKPSYAKFEWHRKPTAPTITPNRKPIDIDDFSLDFQTRLRMFDKAEKSLKRKRSDDQIDTPTPARKKHAGPHPYSHQQPSSNDSRPSTQSQFVSTPTGNARIQSPKRRLVQVPRRPSSSSISSSSRSCSGSSDSSSSTISSHSSPSTWSEAEALSPAPIFPQHFFSQRLSWHTTKFAQWSSIPTLTLNCLPFKIPFSPRF